MLVVKLLRIQSPMYRWPERLQNIYRRKKDLNISVLIPKRQDPITNKYFADLLVPEANNCEIFMNLIELLIRHTITMLRSVLFSSSILMID